MRGGADGPERRRAQAGEPKRASRKRRAENAVRESRRWSRVVGDLDRDGTVRQRSEHASATVTTLERAPYSPRPTRRQLSPRAFI
jgi:hypothetical protein